MTVISRRRAGLGYKTVNKTRQRAVSLALPQRLQGMLRHFPEMAESSEAEDRKEHTYSPFSRPSWDY